MAALGYSLYREALDVARLDDPGQDIDRFLQATRGQMMPRPKLAYIMSRFPGLSETFILRELNGVQSLGWEIVLYPLIVQDETVTHDGVDRWMERVRRVPWVSMKMIASNLKWFFLHPVLYLSTLIKTLWENKTSLNFLGRAILLFPRAVLMADLMRADQVGHIHAHFATHPALVAWIIHRLTGISYSVTVHAHDIFVRQAMLATKLKDAAFVIAISEFNRDYLGRHLGAWIGEKTHIVHCGIDPPLYRPRNGKSPDERCFRVISVGGLRPYKGMSYLVEAAAILRDWSLPVYYTIVGEGEERAALESLIRRRHLEGVVQLIGAKTQAEVAELLSTADCYVQPSVMTPNRKMDGIPVALMEAMATRLPVIASGLSGIPELVIPGRTGYLVPQANARALAEAIAHVYCHPFEAAAYAESGCRHVLNEFNLNKNVERLSSLFAGLKV